MVAPSGCSSRHSAEHLAHLHGVAADILGPSSFLTLFGDDTVMLLGVVLIIAGRASRAGRREGCRREDGDGLGSEELAIGEAPDDGREGEGYGIAGLIRDEAAVVK